MGNRAGAFSSVVTVVWGITPDRQNRRSPLKCHPMPQETRISFASSYGQCSLCAMTRCRCSVCSQGNDSALAQAGMNRFPEGAARSHFGAGELAML